MRWSAWSVVGTLLLAAVAQSTTVWLIPHSHCDVGWLKTIDEYYDQQVRYIYNTVFEELPKDPRRRFIIVEMAFFSMWWNEASPSQKAVAHQMLANGQIEFVVGGWAMNDDADPTYSASTNQMTEGHAWLRENFNVTPRIGWQIDPFGLSSYYPTMNAMMGFNAHVINRIHYSLKDEWKASKHMEFIWRGSNSLGEEVEMFTHILDNHYSFPNGFNFEKDTPITDANIASKAQTLVTDIRKRAAYYLTEHLLIPGGDDFRWQNATVQFVNWDKLIDYINDRSDEFGVTIKYATLSEYFSAVASVPDVDFPVYTEDFFPYADNADSYWTGYFTTHSQLKGLIRETQSLGRTTELFAQAAATEGDFSVPTSQLLPLRYAQAEAQHHDGVTGTSKIAVINMYYDHLLDGTDESEEVQAAAFAALLGGGVDASGLSFDMKAATELSGDNVLPFVVSNTLGWSVDTVHSIFVPRDDLVVLNKDGGMVASQVIPTHDPAMFEYVFEVSIPAAGYKVFYLQAAVRATTKLQKAKRNVAYQMYNDAADVTAEVVGDALRITISQNATGAVSTFEAQMYEYTSYTGSGQKSGAYIFRTSNEAAPLTLTDSSFVDGPLVQEIRLTYGPTHEMFLRVARGGSIEEQGALQVRFRVGVLEQNREVIVRYRSDLDAPVFYSDNNGIEVRARVHERSTKFAANYYPMVMQSHLEGDSRALSFFSDRTVGVGSQVDGEIEMMLHRRCQYDDGRGMNEPLDDTTIVYPRFWLLADTVASNHDLAPLVNMRLQYRPRNIYGTAAVAPSEWAAVRAEYSFLKGDLPRGAHLMSIKTDASEDWSSAVVRVQNIYESARSGATVSVDLLELLQANYSVSNELELTATQPLDNVDRLDFTPRTTEAWGPLTTVDKVTTLRPMDIRTFRFTFE